MSDKTALVLCGGGAKGAIEVGFYRAIVEKGIKIDLVVGSSIGAINGAFISAGVAPYDLDIIWRNLRMDDLYGFNWNNVWKFFSSDSFYDHSRFRYFLKRYLPVREFESLQIPLIVPCTNLQTGEPVYLRNGNLIDALMASMAMPGVFPPQKCQDCQLVDGSVSDNVPIDIAVMEGATTILCMEYTSERVTGREVHGLVKIISRAFSIAMDRKTICDIRYYRDKARLIVLQPDFGMDVEILDFSHTAELLERSYTFSKEVLDKEYRP